MSKSSPLRSLGDLQQYLSEETRADMAHNANAAPAEPDPAPATDADDFTPPDEGGAPTLATLRVTYNLSVTKIVAAFIADNVLSHYLAAPPSNVGTLGSFELNFSNMDSLTDVINLVSAARIPTVKFFTTMHTAPVQQDADADAERNAADVAAYERDIDDHRDPAEPTAPVEASDAADAAPDTYMGRRVLEPVETPAATTAYPDLDPNAETAIYHIATATVYVRYPTLAEAEHAFAVSNSPRKHEFTLTQSITPERADAIASTDAAPEALDDEPVAAAADDLAAGPYTLMMLDGERWDTISLYPSAAAAREWIWSNVRADDFNADEWTLYNHDGEELDLADMFAVPTPVVTDTAHAPAPVSATPVQPATVEPLTDRTDRAALIAHIASFFSLLGLPVKQDLHALTDTALQDLLRLLESNNGGSIEAASVIRAVDESYTRFMKSPTLALKMQAYDIMGRKYFEHVQRIQEVLGGDATVAGMKGAAYHEQLKLLVSHISVINDAVMDLGALLNVRIPVDGLSSAEGGVPAAEGLPFNPKLCMYVLEIFRANIENLHTRNRVTQEDLKRANTAAADARNAMQRIRDEANAAIEAYRQREAALTALLADNSETYWVLRAPSGRYLAKIDPASPASSVADLHLTDNRDDALQLPSRSRAMSLADKLAQTTRFRKVTLRMFRVTMMAED